MSEATLRFLVEAATADLALALAKRRKISETDALDIVYHSDFYKRLSNPQSGLCTESTASLVHLFMQELGK